jgi:gamma-glutamylcyclotransferase (GGCT)/AIG2-like uncharacterized protein YtfP
MRSSRPVAVVDEVRVFVYGTLRRDARGPTQSALTRDWSFEGYGTIEAELYDFGAYPGAIASSAPGAKVRGEIYAIPDAAETLALLDHYEGCGPGHEQPHEFTRAVADVALESGGAARAWVYWYQPEPRGRRLPSGDYLERTGPGGVSREQRR